MSQMPYANEAKMGVVRALVETSSALSLATVIELGQGVESSLKVEKWQVFQNRCGI